jgi:glycosyltransferase involved in cell wall biosynthesis
LALFTNQFPARLNTFFARDVKALLDHGIDVEVFPIYPEDPALWACVPGFLGPDKLPRSKVHHCDLGMLGVLQNLIACLRQPHCFHDVARIMVSSLKYGPVPLIKSAYAALKAFRWHQENRAEFDFVLSYWGNFSATAAYLFHRLSGSRAGFGFYLHAGVDLYRDQVFLREKMNYADVVFVVCEFNRQFIRQLYPQDFDALNPKIQLHHLGVDLEELKFVAEGREPATLLGVGTHHWRKGFDYVVRAAAKIKAAGTPVKLRLIGEGPETPRLRRLARELGIAQDVVFEGWLPFEAVAEKMRRATVFVHASPDLGDAVPTVIKEAMAVGLPVVATSVAGIPELLDQGRCGLLVAPKNVDALAKAATQLLENHSLRTVLARQARAYAEGMFNQEVNGARLAESIKQICRSHKPGDVAFSC